MINHDTNIVSENIPLSVISPKRRHMQYDGYCPLRYIDNYAMR